MVKMNLNLRTDVPLAMLNTHFNISIKGINDDVKRVRFSGTSSLGGGGKMAAGIFITLTQKGNTSGKRKTWMNVLEISQMVKPYFAPYTAVALQPFICKRIDNRIAESKNTAD